MEKRIGKILRDLYRIDPALRGREEEMKKAIREMLAGKPDARMDARFERELKERLLASFSAKGLKKGPRGIFASTGFRVIVGVAAAACLTVAVTMRLGLGAKVPDSVPVSVADLAKRESGVRATTSSSGKGKADPAEISGLIEAQVGGRRAALDSMDLAASETKARPAAPLPSGSLLSVEDEKERAEALQPAQGAAFNTEGYDRIVENPFYETVKEPLSTFSIDVDTASYANLRRYIESGSLPPPDAVRIEELVNYFTYAYAEPKGRDPMAYDAELSACPWNAEHYLLRIGLQARRVAEENLPPSNLVFLIDVSGSMVDEDKLPLVKESLKLLAAGMRRQDRISLVVYAGAAGQVLPPTSGDKREAIMKAIDRLQAGGSTAGGEGIELAYEAARKAFIAEGNNRVILATDGDFNVGVSSDGALVRLIEEKRKSGIFLTVLGFGTGNYKDSKMQKIADSGNGNYAYIDSLKEAEKVLSREMAGTLFAVAKDVKIQIEFNPATVASYRLLGYEKRILAAQDFDDDAKDSGELGAGRSVTALYEIVPAHGGAAARSDLKYQRTEPSPAAGSGDLMTIKFRYKEPDGEQSRLLETAVPWKPVQGRPSGDFRFAAAVAEWGLLLRDSAHKGSASYAQVEDLAEGSLTEGRDAGGYRTQFLQLVRTSRALSKP